MKHCSYCGRNVGIDAAFCSACGSKIIATTEQKELNRPWTRFLRCLWTILLIPVIPSMFLVAMLFDAPGSSNSIFTMMLALSIITAPASYILAILPLEHSRKNLIFAPMINILMAVISLAGIAFVQGGSTIPR